MPTFDWAIATDGFFGAVLGGAVTGGALWLTIWHDRDARKDDRAHDIAMARVERQQRAGADVMLAAASLGSAVDRSDSRAVITELQNRWVATSLYFCSQLEKTLDARFNETLDEIEAEVRRMLIPDGFGNFADASSLTAGQDLGIFLAHVGDWLRNPEAVRCDNLTFKQLYDRNLAQAHAKGKSPEAVAPRPKPAS